jgi:hypothetical protein
MTTITISSNPSYQGAASVAVSSLPTAAAGAPEAHRVPIFIPRDQAYYWTPTWQASEAIALGEIASGDVRYFESGDAAAAWLLSDDDA